MFVYLYTLACSLAALSATLLWIFSRLRRKLDTVIARADADKSAQLSVVLKIKRHLDRAKTTKDRIALSDGIGRYAADLAKEIKEAREQAKT